jgi:Protein of unknown function (DUF5131)
MPVTAKSTEEIRTIPVLVKGRVREAPLPDGWRGVLVADQTEANVRMPILLDVEGAQMRFIRLEPKELIDIGKYMSLYIGAETCHYGERHRARRCDCIWAVDWVTLVGQYGPSARPMHPDWVRSIRDECQTANVPFFFLGWGEWAPAEAPAGHVSREATEAFLGLDGRHWLMQEGGPGRAYMRRVGKQAAGRLLDGRTWDEFPQPVGEPT